MYVFVGKGGDGNTSVKELYVHIHTCTGCHVRDIEHFHYVHFSSTKEIN